MPTSSISSGQTSSGLTVSGGITLDVLAGGTVSGTMVQSGGSEYISGGSAAGTQVSSGGAQYVVSGGVASGAVVSSGGIEFVSAGGSALSTTLSSGGFQSVGSGGVASDTVANVYTYAFVLSGGAASFTTVSSGGIEYVSGGSAVDTVLDSSGFAYVVFGGAVTGTVVSTDAAAFVSANGVANSTTVENGGTLVVSGGSAFATVLNGGGEIVGSGGIDRSTTVLQSALDAVSSGGVASRTTIAAGGAALVLSGGSAVSAIVASGGLLVVLSGGHTTSTTIASGGAVSSAAVVLEMPAGVSAWASSAGPVTVGTGDTLYVVTSGLVSAATLDGGSDVVQGGTAVATVIITSGRETVLAGGLLSSSTVGAGGVEIVSSGGSAVAGRVTNGGIALVSSGGNLSVGVIGAGGSAVISVGGSGGGVTIAAGGLLVLSSGASAYGSLAFSGFGGVLQIGGTVMPDVTISGFGAGNTIDLINVADASAALNSSTDVLAVTSGSSTLDLQLTGSYAGTVLHVSGDGNSGSIIDIPCFAAGTRIATGQGEVPVEALAPGDRVRTQSGPLRPVRWIGRRRVACARHPRPDDVQPIRIAAGAFAPGQPRRDLWLSPDHAVFSDGVLIPVRYLVNGTTVAPVAVDSIDYLHVELDRHDVIFADGLPAESFLDTGNRGAFANGGGATVLHPDFSRYVWQTKGCAELVTSGEKLAGARHLLLARAAALGHRITSNPGLAVLADGRRLAAEVEGTTLRVRLPAAASMLTLRSRIWIPAHTEPDAIDTRRLGVAIARLALDGRALPLGSPLLAAGWHALEAHWRWTDGAAAIKVAGAREVSVTLAIRGRYWHPFRGGLSRVAMSATATGTLRRGQARVGGWP